jgi:CNH domain
VAIGTDDGVYMKHLLEVAGILRSWVKVLDHRNVTQIDVLEKFDVFLVLADKKFFAYPLFSVMQNSRIAKQPQQLSAGDRVEFFTTGILKARTLVLFKSGDDRESVFKVMEPIAQDADGYPIRRRRIIRKDLLRKYDVPLNA